MNLIQALRRAADSDYGVRLFGRDGSVVRKSFAQLLSEAILLAEQLHKQGLRADDAAALIAPTGFEFVRALFALFLLKARPFCLATPRLGRMADYSGATSALLRAAGARVVLAEEASRKQLQSAASACELGLLAIDESDALDNLPDLDSSLAALPGCQSKTEDIALIQFSSGTTVDPKPIALSHGNLLANTRAILSVFPGAISDHSGCSWLPLHHDMGLIGGLITAFVAPGDITLVRPEDFVARPALWLQALSESGATVSPAPNFALQMCAERVRQEDLVGLDLSRLQMALIGAETVHEATLRRFAERFAECGFRYEAFTPVYGLAEATLAVTFSAIGRAPQAANLDRTALAEGRALSIAGDAEQSRRLRVVSVGRPLPGVEVELRDASAQAAPEGSVGKIFVRGPSVMSGYYLRPEATAQTLRNGWLDTGDLGFIYEDELYIYGREKDVIIIHGRNHDPAMIEHAVHGAGGLQHDRAVAFAIADERRASEGFVLLAEKERGKADAAALARAAREAIIAATGLIPERVGVLEAGKLPRTTSGKVRRGAAARLYLAGLLETLAESRRDE
ncbi:MAG: AMP-binding protein [Leptospirales bacterium]|nr:AMP-binding protein [Leptospirales bacterium]